MSIFSDLDQAIIQHYPRGGTCQNFDRDASPIFLGLKFGQILFFWVGSFLAIFWVSQNFHYFLGLTNSQLFFGSSNFCITHLNPLNEERDSLIQDSRFKIQDPEIKLQENKLQDNKLQSNSSSRKQAPV